MKRIIILFCLLMFSSISCFSSSIEEEYREGMDLIYRYQGDSDILEEASEKFRHILEKDKMCDLGYAGLGRVCYWGFYIGGTTSDVGGIREYGLKIVNEGLQVAPYSVKLHATKSELLRRMKNFDEAEMEAQEALNIDPNDLDAILAMAHLQKDRHQYEESLELLNTAMKLVVTEDLQSSIYGDTANVYKYSKDYSNALKYYKKTLAINEEAPWTYNNLGNLYIAMEKYEEAIDCFDKALKIANFGMARSNRCEAQYKLAQKHYRNKAWTKALELFTLVYEQDPEYKKITEYLALCHYNTAVIFWNKDWEKVEEHLRLSEKFDPDSAPTQEALKHLPQNHGARS